MYVDGDDDGKYGEIDGWDEVDLDKEVSYLTLQEVDYSLN